MTHNSTGYVNYGRDQINIDKLEFHVKESVAGEKLFQEGLQLLNKENYRQSISKFKESIDVAPFFPESYYYLAISLLYGRSPRKIDRNTIVQIEECLESAVSMEFELTKVGSPKFYTLWAVVKYGYYSMNSLREKPPSSKELFAKGRSIRADDADEILGYISDPSNKYLQALFEKFKKHEKPLKKPVTSSRNRIKKATKSTKRK